MTVIPRYVGLARSGELSDRAARAAELLRACTLCPRACVVNRTAGEHGYCGAGELPSVFNHMSHPGEEPPISGTRGSGTIFMSGCTLACVYCQNARFSQEGGGTERSVSELAEMMLGLQRAGCHNVNIVTPTHHTAAVLAALALAAEQGLSVPLVWNTSSYEAAATLELLDGVVDIYLADLRYADEAEAARYSDAPDYVAVARAALVEMRRQVGILTTDDAGIAQRGLIVRHLVMPGGVSGTAESMDFVARELGADTFVGLMSQYYPAHRAAEHPRIARRLTAGEWSEAVQAHADAGLTNGWVQAFMGDVSPMAGTNLEPDA
ncbi:radical SAM protein [bacterium]|nr:radical SAM protein [bacterium]